MRLFGKKAAVKEQETVTAEEEVRSLKEKLLPLRELGRSAIEQKDRLQNEEKVTIEGIDRVGASFELVEEKYQGISDSVTDFRTEFDNAREVTNHLDEIIGRLIEKEAGLFLDLAAYSIVTANNAGPELLGCL